MSKAIAFELDCSDGYVAYKCRNVDEAWEEIIECYPEVLEKYTKEDLKLTFIRKCMDCGYNYLELESDDCWCGECGGEERISQRKIKCYHLTKI